MPKVFLTIPEKYESITRPSAMGIVKQVMENTGIGKNARIVYLGGNDQALQPGSNIGTDVDKGISTAYSEKIDITIEEDYAEDRLSSQVLYRPENAFIFLDKSLETYIKPVYSTTRVQVNFRFYARDRVTAIRWRDDFKTRMTDMRDVMLYQADYEYPIPKEMFVILEEIFTLREKQGGYGDTLDKYFMDHVDSRMRVITNQAGKNALVVMGETQGEVVGLWDFDRVPRQMEKASEAENYAIDVGFVYNYDQPVGCDMSYPLVIHNQMIKYRPSYDDRPDRPIDRAVRRTSSGNYLAHFNYKDETVSLINQQGLMIPRYDEFIANQIVLGTMRVVTALVAITPTDKRFLINLRDFLPEYTFKPRIERLLQSEAPFIHMPYRSIFNISLYRSTTLQYWDKIYMDEDLNIFAVEDLNIREYYHIRLSALYDLRSLRKPDRERLKPHGCAFADIIHAMMPQRPPVKTIGNCYVSSEEIEKAADDLEAHTKGIRSLGGWQFNTVETLYVDSSMGKDRNATT